MQIAGGALCVVSRNLTHDISVVLDLNIKILWQVSFRDVLWLGKRYDNVEADVFCLNLGQTTRPSY